MAKRIIVQTDTGEVFEPKAERFIKRKTEVWREVIKKKLFSDAEERVLNRLCVFLQWNTNAIISTKGGPMAIEEMAKAIDMDASHFRRYLRQLVRKNALGIWKSGYDETYYMNPFLYEFGTIDRWLFGRFDDELDKKAFVFQGSRFKVGKREISLLDSEKCV